jgi:hypothetical protein
MATMNSYLKKMEKAVGIDGKSKKRYVRHKRSHTKGGWFKQHVEHRKAAALGWRRRGVRFSRKNQDPYTGKRLVWNERPNHLEKIRTENLSSAPLLVRPNWAKAPNVTLIERRGFNATKGGPAIRPATEEPTNSQPVAWAIPKHTMIRGLGEVIGYADSNRNTVVVRTVPGKIEKTRMKDGRIIEVRKGDRVESFSASDPRIQAGLPQTVKTRIVTNAIRGLEGKLPERMGGLRVTNRVVRTSGELIELNRQKDEKKLAEKAKAVSVKEKDAKVSEFNKNALDLAKRLGITQFVYNSEEKRHMRKVRRHDKESEELMKEKDNFNKNLKNLPKSNIPYAEPVEGGVNIIEYVPAGGVSANLRVTPASIEHGPGKIRTPNNNQSRPFIPVEFMTKISGAGVTNILHGPGGVIAPGFDAARKIQYQGSKRQYNQRIRWQNRTGQPLSTPLRKPHKEKSLTYNRVKRILDKEYSSNNRGIKGHKRSRGAKRSMHYSIANGNAVMPAPVNTPGGLRLEYIPFAKARPPEPANTPGGLRLKYIQYVRDRPIRR